jgi:glycosyltransferase involved in cell wall biosynthesis
VEVSSAAGPAEGALMRQKHGLHAGELVLLSVGRLEHNKGFDVLAAALGRASSAGTMLSALGWRWVIVGTGPYRREIEREVRTRGVDGHTIFAGRATEADLHAWYEAASVFVHPTRYEGSSIVTLEAMAHRKAVIATRAGGLPDKVRPGLNGWLVDPGDPEALAEAVLAAAADPARLPEMGARSREIVAREFSWTVIVEQQIALYRALIAGATRARREP